MQKTFIIVGENIHCTRVYKVGGALVKDMGQGAHAVVYGEKGATKQLPIPERFTQTADWKAGKVKHCAVAVWQGLYGDAAGKAAAKDYLQFLALRQQAAGAAFLDVNVDEFSTDVDERCRVIRWVADIVQEKTKIPLSIDSSNPCILQAGLDACDKARGKPMVNSVSLERAEAVNVAAASNAVVIASAAGEKDLPSTTEQRLENLGRLMPKLQAAGLKPGDIYVDPLVFPVGTDSNNGKAFLDAVKAVRERYGADIHITGGLSNVSFGMPNRKLINVAFSWLALDAGADSGIVDPLQINSRLLAAADVNSEPFKLARALLTGEDMFGVEYITAHREGRLGAE
jgi:5-methyltetrahydrofolate--homocysteine methyltransferase